jgi:O-antigen ligase
MTETDVRPGDLSGVEDAADAARSDAGGFWSPPFTLLIFFFVLEYVRPMLVVQFRFQMLIVLLMPVLWFTSRERPWSRNLTLQLCLVVLCGLSAFWAENYFSAVGTTRELFGHFSIALAITWLLCDRSHFATGAWAWVLTISYQAMYAITHGGVGTGGFIGDENDLALACGTAFPFAFIGFRHLPGWKRWACGGLAVLFAAAVVASFSRGGFLGFAAAGFYCFMTGRNRLRTMGIGLIAAVAFFLALPAEYKEELTTIRDTSSGTAQSRRFLWAAAVNMWIDNPLLGVGAGNSVWNIGRYQPEGGRYSARQFAERDWTLQHVHSAYFQLLSEVALVGCLLVVVIVISHFSTLRRLRREVGSRSDVPPDLRRDADLYSVSLAGAMVGFLAGGLFLSAAYYPYLWYLAAMGVALDRAVRAELPEPMPLEADVEPIRS